MKHISLHLNFLFILSLLVAVAACKSEKSKNKAFTLNVEADIFIKDRYVISYEEDTLNVADLIKEGPTIFLDIPKIYCVPCIEQETNLVARFNQRLGQNKIVVLTTFENFRDFLVFRNTLPGDIPCYNKLGIDSSNISIPIYCIVEPSIYKVGGICYVQKNKIEASEEFLSLAIEKYYGLK